jgi:hypothetical protein
VVVIASVSVRQCYGESSVICRGVGVMARSRSNGEDIMVVRCPVRRLGIVRRDRSCMSEQWATIQRCRTSSMVITVHMESLHENQPINYHNREYMLLIIISPGTFRRG